MAAIKIHSMAIKAWLSPNKTKQDQINHGPSRAKSEACGESRKLKTRLMTTVDIAALWLLALSQRSNAAAVTETEANRPKSAKESV